MHINLHPAWIAAAALAPVVGAAALTLGWINFLSARELADPAALDYWSRLLLAGALLCCAPALLLGIGATRGRQPKSKPSGALARVRARR